MIEPRKDKETIRAFIAIELEDPETLEAIARYQADLQKSIGPLKLVGKELMHVTIRFLGEIPLEHAKTIYEFLEASINSRYFSTAPVEAALVGVGDFGKKAFFIEIVGVDQLLQTIFAEVTEFLNRDLHIAPEQRGFSPHLTIARAREGRDRRDLAKGNPGQKSYAQLKKEWATVSFGPWHMKKVYLKQSVLTPKGPIYSNLRF